MPNSVLREQAGAVATITINRPAARNALTNETKVSLLSALRDCSDDPGIRAVILTGAGEAFCAGQDLREHADQLAAGGSPVDTVRDHYNPMVMTITGMAKPVIAALPGVAAGAGKCGTAGPWRPGSGACTSVTSTSASPPGPVVLITPWSGSWPPPSA